MSAYNMTVGPLDNTALAAMATAGAREINQTAHSATGSSATTYTVTGDETRRVMLYYAGTVADAIRLRCNATAAATHMPLPPQRHVFYSVTEGEYISLYNTATAAATVNIMEIA